MLFKKKPHVFFFKLKFETKNIQNLFYKLSLLKFSRLQLRFKYEFQFLRLQILDMYPAPHRLIEMILGLN